MPQQPADDWVDVTDDWEDWEPVSPVEEEEPEPVITRPAITRTAAEPVPRITTPSTAPMQQPPSWFDTISDTAKWAAEPLFPGISSAGRAAGQFLNQPTQSEAVESGYYPMIRGFVSGATEGIGDVLAGLTSPLNLATMGSFGAGGVAATRGLPMAAKGLTNVGRALSAPVAAQGAYHTATAETPVEALMGVAEMAGGAAGVKQPMPRVRPRATTPIPSMSAATPEALPVRPPVAETFDLPLQESVTPEVIPETSAVQESLPIEPEAPTGLEFIDPETGITVPASEAQPGMVPVTKELTAAQTPISELPTEAPQTPADWFTRLVNEESGEFRPAELMSNVRRMITGEETGVIPESIETRPENRIRRAPERDIRWDVETESFFDRNAPNWDDVAEADLSPAEIERARAINRGEIPDPTGYTESAQTLSRFDKRVLEEPRTGKSLEEVEAGKKRPALERLGKMIGEEHAQKLASGETKIEYNTKPVFRGKAKRLPASEIQGWSDWGDNQLRQEKVSPGKPGLSVEQGSSMPELFPNAFDIIYRDKKGIPIGVLKTDLQGKGISTLAVRSDLGLRRGKVAFEMLKQSFDRGITEPSGMTSDLTKNLIDRVKRLVGEEKGEFDPQTLFDNLNELMGAARSSKAGQLIERFIKEEGGELNLPRFEELFQKMKAGTLTPDELIEARTMAKEHVAAQTAEPPSVIPGVRRVPSQRPQMPPAAPRQASGPFEQTQAAPVQPSAQNLRARLDEAAILAEPVQGTLPLPPVKPPKIPKGPMHGPAPMRPRKIQPGPESSMISQMWNVPRTLQSVDLPGVTSAALRQARPLAFTTDWFKAWGPAVKAFGSEQALKAINAKIAEGKYFQPKYMEIKNKAGQTIRYKEQPSFAEKSGLQMTDILSYREEAISSSLAEKIPGYGRYVKASNRAYTAFLNHLRAAKFEQLVDGAKAMGRDPEVDLVLGKKIADFTNNATGRGSLKFFGERANLEPIAGLMGAGLYSPRALSARLAFMNPTNYIKQDPIVRREYMKGLARIGVSWGAFAGLASLMPGVHVGMNPLSSDFGKIRVGNTRYDPGAGFQQLMVLASREAPQVLGGGGTRSSSVPPGKVGPFVPFGEGGRPVTRLTLAGRYIYNQLNPSLRFVFDMLSATRDEPFDLTDKSLQQVLPMYAEDIAAAAADDAATAEFFAPLLGSLGIGGQTYEGRDFTKPKITPFIEDVTGIKKIPTLQIGR